METEAKYIVPDEATFARLQKATKTGPYVRRDTKVKTVHDRYVDTPEHLFYSRKYFVRLRESQNGSPLITIKSLGAPVEGAVHSREEYQSEVSGLDISTWPEGKPRQIALEIAGDRPLTDFVNVDQVRTVSVLYDGERAVAEMSLDEITTQTPGEPVRAYELEVELLPDGTLEDLKAISARLEKTYHLQPQPLSKFERALLLSATSEPSGKDQPKGKARSKNGASAPQAVEREESPRQTAGAPSAGKKETAGISPTDSMDQAARKLLAFYFKDILKNEEGTRDGHDPEDLHDMRVATRRMRAVLQIFEPYLQSEPTGQLRRGLRSLTRALGAVRDLDVLIKNAEDFCASLPEDERPGLQGLIDGWAADRKKGQKLLRRVLDSPEYARFKEQTAAYTEEREAGSSTEDTSIEPHQVRHLVAGAVWEKYETVRAFETVMSDPVIEQLHALRIKSKYLRYALECFREVLPESADKLIGDVVKVQDHLGELHDASVAVGLGRDYMDKRLREAARSRKAKKSDVKSLPGLEKYLDERESTIQRLREDFFPVWDKISGHGWRSKLAQAVASV